jgi:isoleucyl-tRNA synthetase
MPIEGRPSEYFLVWTTTPWTLPANVALAVHPDLEYAKVSLEGETYYLSAKTVPVVLRGRGQEVQTLRGSDLLEWRYRTPFADLAAQEGIVHRVVPWNDVGEDEGTGIVHIAPGCGVEDFGLGKEQRLAVVVPIDDNGIFLPGFGPLAGKSVHSVNDEVIQLLGERGMLHRVEQIEHRYPTCWRCGQPIVFRAATEWFISAQEIRPRMLEAARTVEWTPPSALKRMEDWLHNMQDWCISRRRYWGLPLPFYDCPVCKSLTVVGSVDELRQLSVSGMDEVRELHRPWIDAVRIRCPGCGREVERIAEVGDCWLDAGIVPFSTLGPGALKDPETWQKWYPAHWVSEMREQIRLWFYSMLFMSVTLEDRAPYRRVLTYEKLMDEKGQPMHKSLGNAIWFDEAADKMGADVMRWLYAGQNLQTNLLFGYGPAEEVRRRLLTLWNVYSYYVTYAETEGFVPSTSLAEGQLSRMDRWVLSRLQSLLSLADDRLRAYDVGALVSATDRFVDDLSTWYLRRSRRRFSRSASPEDRRAAFATLYECLLTLARTVAPVMPFLAEELYQNLVRSWDRDAPESIHLTPYPEADLTRVDPELEAEMALAQDIVRLGRSARTEAGIRVRQPLAAITVCRGETGIELSTELCEEIADELNVKEVQFAAEVAAFARRVVRPNPKLLGPRLGRELPEVSRALQAREYTIDQDGSVRVGPHVLTGDEVSITLEPAADQAIAQDLQVQGGLAVALDRALTSELLAEGRVRELIRRVQAMRQEAGLSIEDRINLAFDGSPSWKEIVTVNAEQIRGAVGAVQLNGDIAAATARELRWSGKLDDEEVSLTLSRVT